MRPLPGQLDLFDHDPARLARMNREAAAAALLQGNTLHYTAQERHDYYINEAERLERLATIKE